jgi:NAD(P)-dependent dehydrogenase (short-subunit alcohol dehydrogenase family)
MLQGAEQIPGWLDEISDRSPLGRPGEAEEVAQVALALHQLDWVTGESIAADGGLRLHSAIDSFGAVQRARGQR